jgi:hypothetical protein
MKEVIDNFDSLTGWMPEAGSAVVVHGENEHPEFIAGNLAKSLIFHFPAGSAGHYTEKTLAPAFDVEDYDEIVVSVWSQNKHGSYYNLSSDFPYILDFGTGKQFYIPVWETFTQITIDVSALATLERIRIIANHDVDDYLALSYMIAVKDEIPRDIFEAFKDGMEAVRLETWPEGGPAIATLAAAAAAQSVTFGGDRDFLQELAVIKIKDGLHSEVHQLAECAGGGTFKFTGLYDGKAMKYTYSAATVYLQYQIEFGRLAIEAIFPGVGVWGFVPTPMGYTPPKDETIKSYFNGEFQFKKGGMNESWRIVIDVQARDPENIADMTAFVRRYLARYVVWLNGRDFDIQWQEVPIEEEPNEAVGILHSMKYLIDIEIVEDINTTVSRPKVLTDKLAINIVTPQ